MRFPSAGTYAWKEETNEGEKQYIGSIDLCNNGWFENEDDDRGNLYIEKNEEGEYWLCCDNSEGEKLDIFLGPANSKNELISMAEEEWKGATADEDLCWY
ncbi:MAG TPA: hypothetical protein VL122_00135 [Nitrospirota bacterium]|nr:hypothetical protein [Nitrospirota bacterium]